MKQKDFFKGLAAGVLLTLAVLIIAIAGLSHFSGSILSEGAFFGKLKTLETLIKKNYLGETDNEELKNGIYTGMLESLGDKYSRYYTAEEYEKEKSAAQGTYVGIGITLAQTDDGEFKVYSVYEGSPGEDAGILSGDIILTVDGQETSSMQLSDVVSAIREKAGDEITLTVEREGQSNPVEITAAVTDVEIESVTCEMLDDEIGYIKIAEFTSVTADQYKEAYETLKEEGMERLIIDLRDNPGGLVTSVCSVLEQILPEGVIVYTEDNKGNRQEQTCDGRNELDLPLAVLVNGSSASAAEIFAGAVKDYGIGTIVGTTTYGKGVVQAIYPLTDGSAVKFTVSNYYTPNGNSIDGTGIEPDITVEAAESTEPSDEGDNQLQAAIEAVHDSK